MQLDPYHHEHTIVEEIPWSRLGKLLIQLAIKIRSSYNPEVVVGIAKGGVIPAVFLSKEIMKQNAKEICTAALAVHENSVKPDYFILKTDALIVWPWDRDVLSGNDTWSINPEYMKEMTKITGYIPGPSPACEPMGQWEK